MAKYTPKTQRAIARYGYEACLEAFRLNDKDGHGARTVAIQVGLLGTRSADAAIDAGREIAAAEALHVTGWTNPAGKIEFTVTSDEWRAELPKFKSCYDLPLREYQIRAIVKKAAKVSETPVYAFQF